MNKKTREFGTENNDSKEIINFDNNAEAIANEKMGSAPQKLTLKKPDSTIEWFRANGRIETNQSYKLTVDLYVNNFEGLLQIRLDDKQFLTLGTSLEAGYHHVEVPFVATTNADFISFFTPSAAQGGGSGTFYVGNVHFELTALAK